MAKILRIDHIAVAVKDVDAGIAKYQTILGAELVEKAELSIMGNRMSAAYLKVGDGLIVLDGAVEPDGFIAKFIERRGEGLHHLGIVVDDLDGYVEELEAAGVRIAHRESLGPLRREILLSPKDLCRSGSDPSAPLSAKRRRHRGRRDRGEMGRARHAPSQETRILRPHRAHKP